MNRAWIFGSLLVTTCVQGGGAPLVDPCFSHSEHGAFKGLCFYGRPWLPRDRRPPARSLVIGWRSWAPNGAPTIATGTTTRPLGSESEPEEGR